MSHLCQLLPLAVLLFAGCASAPVSDPISDHSQQKAQIQQVLHEIIDACEKKDLDRLDSYHLYGLEFTKFDTGSPSKLDALAARQGEHNGLTAANDLHMRADDLDIQVFGDTGICTLFLNYSFKTGTGDIHKRVRATLVFVKDRGTWKIVHEHLSSIPGAT